MQHRLAHQVHRHRRAVQQQGLQQHWPDVVAAVQGGAQAEGVHLKRLALGGRINEVHFIYAEFNVDGKAFRILEFDLLRTCRYAVLSHRPNPTHPWYQVMPDLFFYRDPEEVEREEAAKEAEVMYADAENDEFSKS